MSWSSNPELQAATSGGGTFALQSLQNGSASSSGSGGGSGDLVIPDAPDMPDLSELTGLYGRIPKMFNANKIGKAFDSEIDTTRSLGLAAAGNASRSYAARNMQMGINPVAAGAVEAAARAPTYKATNALTVDKEQAKMKAHEIGASLQAQIGAALGNIRSGYTNALMQYNLGAAGLKEGRYEFDSKLDFSKSESGQNLSLQLAKLLGDSPGGGSTDFVRWLMGQVGVGRGEGSPGYVGTTGFDEASGDFSWNGHNVDVGRI